MYRAYLNSLKRRQNKWRFEKGPSPMFAKTWRRLFGFLNETESCSISLKSKPYKRHREKSLLVIVYDLSGTGVPILSENIIVIGNVLQVQRNF